ncbi:MAG: carbon-nitrogen hydrolase family protein [Bacteroidales bacterium]|nr:carbon-nitrogen hydrolase family protein [Bacteroidales bacterium]
MKTENTLCLSIAQISPIWLNKKKTIEKIKAYVNDAGKGKSDLVVFGEALLPGYPLWLSLTNGAEFNSKVQKELYAHYLKNAVQIENGDLDEICTLAKQLKIAIYLGMIERAANRGGHSLYCALIYINREGQIKSVHRKLQPTYDERLVWAAGDGHGLQVHSLKDFTVGGLNCWENWMPLTRSALYGLGENLHIAVWPGSERNTRDISQFIAKESRSFVASASVPMRLKDIPADTPHYDKIVKNAPEQLTDGGSCIAGPDGEWIVEPVCGKEGLITATIDIDRVYEERQNFDPSGHYSRPDVLSLNINRERQSIIQIVNKEN